MSDFDIEDAAGQEILTQTCAAIDRLDEITWCIAQAGGAMVKGQRGLKVNPLLKLEATLRVFVVRSLAKLGLEPVGDVGAPLRGGVGISYEDIDEDEDDEA